MGLEKYAAQFLWNQRRRGVNFGRFLALGRQVHYLPPVTYRACLQALGVQPQCAEYADDFFRGLGATSLDFMDVSDYEGAKIIHDLNEPLPPALAAQYDCVFDGGALEHVFNFPTALKSCMELVRPGGHLIIFTPWNNLAGHGFYQFSPELFYSALSEANGYAVEQMAIVQKGRWYAVADPRQIGARVELVNNLPTLLFLTARRVAARPIFATWPQQSDYSAQWAQQPAAPEDSSSGLNGMKEWLVQRSAWLGRWKMRRRIGRHWKTCAVTNRKSFQPLDLEPLPTGK